MEKVSFEVLEKRLPPGTKVYTPELILDSEFTNCQRALIQMACGCRYRPRWSPIETAEDIKKLGPGDWAIEQLIRCISTEIKEHVRACPRKNQVL